MKVSKLISGVFILYVLLVIPALASETEKQTNTYKGVSELDVSNVTGDIELSSWDKDYVEVTYVKKAEDEEKLDDIIVDINQKGNLLTIDTDMPRNCRRCNVTYTISIPMDFSYLEANTVTGDVYARNLGIVQKFEAKSTTGDIDANLSGESFKLNVVTGDIDLRIDKIYKPGKIAIETITGSVNVSVPEKFSSDIYLSTITGSVRTNFELDKTNIKKKNKLEGVVGDGKGDCNITAITGSIDLRMK
jgi:DUF4097 and DUF4098 domain-containing protein YvlB